MRYRNLSIDRTIFPSESTTTTTLDGPSQNSFERAKDFGTLGSLGRGWKAQGMLTGEWRDRLGRQRRALPSEAPAGKAVREASPNQSDACSVSSVEAPTSFERLVEELRARLPRYPPPLMDVAVAQPTGSVKSVAANAIDGGNSPKQGQATDKRHGYGNSVWNTTATGRKSGAVALETRIVAKLTNRARRAEAPNSDSALPSYTGLRGKNVGNFPPKYGQNEISQPGVGGYPCRQTGYPSSTLPIYQKKNAVNPYRDCGVSRWAMTIVSGSEVSPSAALVAAAKAQERALPLLQVCAVTIADRNEPRQG